MELAESGVAYVNNIDLSNPWIVNEFQAGILRDQLSSGTAELAAAVRIALEIVRDLTAGFSNEDFGRALAEHGEAAQWQADWTFKSQGARYRELLRDSGLIDEKGDLTEHGAALIGPHTSVWWVNQGATYTKARDGGSFGPQC